MKRFLLPLVLLLSCSKQSDENQMIGLVANAYAVASDTYLIDRAEEGMDAWQIGLNTGFRARYRNAGGSPGTYDPAHWVALSPRNCLVMGAPGDMRLNCPLANASVVGICQIINDSVSGQILNTTTLLAIDYQVDELETLSNRLSIFTHEFGHCLGLKHSASTADVMYPDTAGADAPSAGELAAIQYAYTVFQDPTDTSRFFTSNGNVLRHFTMPAFFLYDETNYLNSNGLQIPTAVPTNPVEVHNFLLFADGHEEYYRSL